MAPKKPATWLAMVAIGQDVVLGEGDGLEKTDKGPVKLPKRRRLLPRLHAVSLLLASVALPN